MQCNCENENASYNSEKKKKKCNEMKTLFSDGSVIRQCFVKFSQCYFLRLKKIKCLIFIFISLQLILFKKNLMR